MKITEETKKAASPLKRGRRELAGEEGRRGEVEMKLSDVWKEPNDTWDLSDTARNYR